MHISGFYGNEVKKYEIDYRTSILLGADAKMWSKKN